MSGTITSKRRTRRAIARGESRDCTKTGSNGRDSAAPGDGTGSVQSRYRQSRTKFFRSSRWCRICRRGRNGQPCRTAKPNADVPALTVLVHNLCCGENGKPASLLRKNGFPFIHLRPPTPKGFFSFRQKIPQTAKRALSGCVPGSTRARAALSDAAFGNRRIDSRGDSPFS